MSDPELIRLFNDDSKQYRQPSLALEDGDRVAVMGGGPSGSLFAYFLLDMAGRAGLKLQVDIFEPRDFNLPGPPGCNMCAGIVSESLIQMLAVDGINLPPDVVQRGMDCYMLHNEAGRVRLETPDLERRIGTVFRGAGPTGIKEREWRSFDGFLLEKAVERGANLINRRVDRLERNDGRLRLEIHRDQSHDYDFVAVATGVNTSALRLFKQIGGGYKLPHTAQTFVREYFLGIEKVQETFGHTIHFFMLNIPGLDFAAVVPKGNYMTVCLLGDALDEQVFETFLNSESMQECMPEDWNPADFVCHCAPRINLTGAVHPFADRMVFLGDIGISRLYKDGIGAAYRAAKSAASAVVFGGIGAEDLKRYFGRPSLSMERDNFAGKVIFTTVGIIKPWRFVGEAMLNMVRDEQSSGNAQRRMSQITWDLFTGSAPYREILVNMLNPSFWSRFVWYAGNSLIGRNKKYETG